MNENGDDGGIRLDGEEGEEGVISSDSNFEINSSRVRFAYFDIFVTGL